VYVTFVHWFAATSVTFDVYVNLSLWNILNTNGYISLNVGGSSGYQLTSANSSANIHAVITYPADPTLAVTLAVGIAAGVLQYNQQTDVYTRVPVSYLPSNYVITAMWPSVGAYLSVGVTENLTVSTTVGQQASAWAAAWANQTYTWSVSQQSDLQIQFNSSSQTNITVQPLTKSDYSTSGQKSLNVWFNINLATSGVQHQSNIMYHYTEAQIQAAFNATVDETKLRLAWYDTSKNQWTFPTSGYSVDTNAKVVAQQTSSFSQWGVYLAGSGSTGASSALRPEFLTFGALIALVFGLLKL